MTTRLLRLAVAATITVTTLLTGAPADSNDAHAALSVTVTTVMVRLHNPRGITVAADGSLYVAEAGCGGNTGDCATRVVVPDPPLPPPPQCTKGPGGAGNLICLGLTGSISRLAHGVQQRIATGFPSWAFPAGNQAHGPHDVSGKQTPGGYHLATTIGLRADPRFRGESERGSLFVQVAPLMAQLAELRPALVLPGATAATFKPDWLVADLGTYEEQTNPDGGPLDTNPYGLLTQRDAWIVVDSGANALLRVAEDGAITTLAVFPSRAQFRDTDAVPTAVAVRPEDGAYYVGEFRGVPFSDTHNANIYRVTPGEPLVQGCVTAADCLTGFTRIIDLAFDGAGNLYVLQHFGDAGPAPEPGVLKRVKRVDLVRCLNPVTLPSDCTAANVAEEVLGGLRQPTSVAVGPDGAVYVTNRSYSPTDGEVLKITLPTD